MPWVGRPVEDEFAVFENGVQFLIRPYDGFSVGLFLEHRENRRQLREIATAKRVLNCFAYTCGFSVAAALGGAETVSVDVSKRYLEWGKRNFARNGLSLDGHMFICSDTQDYFRRAARQGREFDLVVLDPPTFGRVKETGRHFSIQRDLHKLVAGASERLAPGGQILLSVNHRGTSLAQMERACLNSAERRHARVTARPKLPVDFAGDAAYSKSLWLEVA
jgi:23S rRNA (cytosine1962-C5)-methyltransferase